LFSARNLVGGATKSQEQRKLGLDLVRALAIASVLIAHFGYDAIVLLGKTPSSTIVFMGNGVELFFVLSGFLIGGLLIDIIADRPSIAAWTTFMIRRWMRTVPLYVLWMLVLLVISPPSGNPAAYVLEYVTFTQNLCWPMPLGNWYGNSWSLAVEEWFYLLFSSTLIGAAAVWSRKSILLTCILFIILPLVARILFASDVADFDRGMRKIMAYRLDAIAYGVILIWVYRRYTELVRRWSIVLLTVGLCFVITAYSIPSSFRPWTFTFLPLGFSLCLPASLAFNVNSPLVVGPIVWLSTRSYGLYITHFLFAELLPAGYGSQYLSLGFRVSLAVGFSVILAELSYRFVEMPILAKRPKQFRERSIATGTASAASEPGPGVGAVGAT
jgi:peptidoglycan/LPS O-acetylase OafA/YrhL